MWIIITMILRTFCLWLEIHWREPSKKKAFYHKCRDPDLQITVNEKPMNNIIPTAHSQHLKVGKN